MKQKRTKHRLDQLVVSQGILPTRQKAQAQIIAGNILVNDVPVTKPGQVVFEDEAIRLRSNVRLDVSRGAQKLDPALDAFNVDVSGRIAVDVGSSTGGFSQTLLRRGVSRVYCVDVGVNLLAWEVRNDSRVVTMEGVNARNLEPKDFADPPNLVVIDVSFISLKLILPSVLKVAAPAAEWVVLIKPQFEVGKNRVGKGGIVRSEADRQEAVESVKSFAESIGLQLLGLIKSPIKGQKGNTEFLAHWKSPYEKLHKNL